MKKQLLFLFLIGLIGFSSYSQNDLFANYNLMPWPKEIKETQNNFLISSDVTISINGENHERVRNAAVNFLRRLTNRTGVFIEKGFPIEDDFASIQIDFDKTSTLSIETDESYSLKISDSSIFIKSTTDIGAIRALETLLQLVNNNESSFYFEGVEIYDEPRFVWRGLMIDVARHFQPIGVIKRNLKAMASVKLNVFHWHLTDDQGFRVESKVYPKLQELASDGLFYTQEQIKDIVSYASNLGIRVIPEFDVPGHASAILTAYPELGSKDGYDYSIERFAGVFDPTLNPTKEIVYEFLENLFTEITPLFPDEYFHIGGDENEGKHWDENIEIQKFKKEHDLQTNHDLQTYFNIKLEKILNNLGKKLMGWDEIMTPSMPTTAVIHSWRGENEGLPKGGSLISAAKTGYQTVLSNGYYIDRMLSVEHHYSVDPIGDVKLSDEERKLILGGEATMWSELVTPITIDSRIWPRTAAIAERFWSPQEINDVDKMLPRLKDVNLKLEELGIAHLKNRAVILRNINNQENNDALSTLSRLCEPLKVYSRNAGGTEYKSFSPFTLFADACIVDAEDAVIFNNNVQTLRNNDSEENIESIKLDLLSWSKLNDEFSKTNKNPNTLALKPLVQNLSKISLLFLNSLKSKKISHAELNEMTALNNDLKSPVLDTELAVTKSFDALLEYCKSNFLAK